MNVTSIFNVSAISEAVTAQTQIEAANGRINATIAELFSALGLPLIQKGKKGSSPRGAADALRALITGDAPAKKAIPIGILAPKTGWPEVAQGLHAYVTTLASVGACDAPEPLPAWADPVSIAAIKAERAAKTKATREANKGAPMMDANPEPEANPEPVEALTPTGAANFLIAALRHDADSVPSALLDQLRALLHVDMPTAAPVAEVSMH